jgi:hypothetical protein
MGLSFDLRKEDNHLYCGFASAYWSIDGIAFYTTTGNITMVRFDFNAYASRDAKLLRSTAIAPLLQFGGPCSTVVDPLLYQWCGEFDAGAIFPNGIPTPVDEQKIVLYAFVKSYLGLSDAFDVLEDGP